MIQTLLSDTHVFKVCIRIGMLTRLRFRCVFVLRIGMLATLSSCIHGTPRRKTSPKITKVCFCARLVTRGCGLCVRGAIEFYN